MINILWENISNLTVSYLTEAVAISKYQVVPRGSPLKLELIRAASHPMSPTCTVMRGGHGGAPLWTLTIGPIVLKVFSLGIRLAVFHRQIQGESWISILKSLASSGKTLHP